MATTRGVTDSVINDYKPLKHLSLCYTTVTNDILGTGTWGMIKQYILKQYLTYSLQIHKKTNNPPCMLLNLVTHAEPYNFTGPDKETAKTSPPVSKFVATSWKQLTPLPHTPTGLNIKVHSLIVHCPKSNSPTPEPCRGRASRCTSPISDLQLAWKRRRNYHH